MKSITIKQFLFSFVGLASTSLILFFLSDKVDWIEALNMENWLPFTACEIGGESEYECMKELFMLTNFYTFPFSFLVSGALCAYWANKLTKRSAKKYYLSTVALTAPFPIYLFIFPFKGFSMSGFFIVTWLSCILVGVFVGYLNYKKQKF